MTAINNRYETLMAEIRVAGQLTEDDRKELHSQLSTPIMKRALFSILLGSDEALTVLANVDLTSELGVKRALVTQAKAQMFTQVVEHLVEFATTETQPEEKEQPNG